MSDGGDAACWADAVAADGHVGRVVVEQNLDSIADSGGAIWSLPASGDLNVNLVRLDPRQSIDHHVNGELDVLIVGRGGAGELVIDGIRHQLRASTVALVPKGSRRAVAAGGDGVTYLTVHERRGSLTIGSGGGVTGPSV